MRGDQLAEFLQWAYGAGIAAGIVGFWCLICYSASWMSGWHTLGQRYRCAGAFSGELWRFRSGKLRWNTNYGGCLTLGANRDGLYLAVLFLFRPGHSPLFLPWSEIAVRRERRGLIWRTRFTLGSETRIPLWTSPRLGDRILEHRPEDSGSIQDVYARPGLDPPRKLF